ncbi:MAG: serine/threonine protein kinase [Ruminococcus sp.]|nr:serine/threonine protein kinase [Ruminococcus sp.]
MAYLGDVIDGKYEILRELGRGGMSIVYLAMDKRLNKQWAIKEFRKDKDDENRRVALESLLKEANIMKKLDHPTLPRIVDIIDQDSTIYIVMDYIEGESLNKVLDAYGAQPQDAVIEWAKQLSEVLDYLHTRKPPVIYRDMKPANIMLKPDGTIRLIDFGIAREYKEGSTGDTEIIGTRGYAAPEQFGEKGQTDARTDIYSLGVTLYHLVTGKNPAEPPYEIYPIRHWNPNLSSGLEWLIQKCTQLNPNDRFQSCAEVIYVLNNLDKFVSTYKHKLRSKLNWFIASVSVTLVCALAGTTMGIVSYNNKANELNRYKSQGTISGYIQAINVDATDYDSYSSLVDLIDKNIDIILPGELSSSVDAETLHDSREMYLGELQKAVSGETLSKLREKSVKNYVKTNYDMGLLILNKYAENKESEETNAISFKKAVPYFRNVISAVEDNNNDYNGCGLDEKQYFTAVYYYLIGDFRESENQVKNSQVDEKGEFTVSEVVRKLDLDYLQIDDSGVIADFYGAYWELLQRSTADVDNNSSLSTKARLNLVYMNSNTAVRLKDQFFVTSSTKDSQTLRPAEGVESFYSHLVSAYLSSEKVIDTDLDKTSEIYRILKERLENTRNGIDNLREELSNLYIKNGKTIKLEKIK